MASGNVSGARFFGSGSPVTVPTACAKNAVLPRDTAWAMSEEKRHLPRVVSAAIYLAVLVVGLLPLVVTGTVAAWAALAFFVLNVVVAVSAIAVDAVELRPAGHRVGGGFARPAVGVAAGVVVLIVTVWEFLPDDKSNPPGASSQPKSVQQGPSPLDRLRDCQRSLPDKICVRRFLHVGGSTSLPANQPDATRK